VYLDRSAPHQLDNLDAWRALASNARTRGFTDIKFDADYTATDVPSDMWNRSIPLPQLNRFVERLTAVREAAGPDMEISLDCHNQYDAESAIRLAQALAHPRLKWLEDPTTALQTDAMVRVRSVSPIPICGGEWYTADQFRELIDAGGCDIVHPDVLFAGGLSETRRIADYAELHGIPLALHNNSSAVGVVASAHVAAATRNFIGLEYHFFDAKWIGDILQRGGRPLFEDGHIVLDDTPGLGGELNEDVCRAHLSPGEVMF
jgi:galactonate dehydratase